MVDRASGGRAGQPTGRAPAAGSAATQTAIAAVRPGAAHLAEHGPPEPIPATKRQADAIPPELFHHRLWRHRQPDLRPVRRAVPGDQSVHVHRQRGAPDAARAARAHARSAVQDRPHAAQLADRQDHRDGGDRRADHGGAVDAWHRPGPGAGRDRRHPVLRAQLRAHHRTHPGRPDRPHIRNGQGLVRRAPVHGDPDRRELHAHPGAAIAHGEHAARTAAHRPGTDGHPRGRARAHPGDSVGGGRHRDRLDGLCPRHAGGEAR